MTFSSIHHPLSSLSPSSFPPLPSRRPLSPQSPSSHTHPPRSLLYKNTMTTLPQQTNNQPTNQQRPLSSTPAQSTLNFPFWRARGDRYFYLFVGSPALCARALYAAYSSYVVCQRCCSQADASRDTLRYFTRNLCISPKAQYRIPRLE